MAKKPHPLIDWNPRFNTGFAQVDDQHRELVDLLNRFAAEVEAEGNVQTAFDEFRDTLRRHFVFEEDALRRLGVTPALLDAHARHHAGSMELLEGLSRRMVSDPREHASEALAEIAHCLLVDLLDEDRYCFMAAASNGDAVASPPIAPALQAFGRLFDLLNEHSERTAQARDYYLTLLDDFPTPVCRADAGGHFDWFNRTWLSLTGRTLHAATSGGWVDAIHPDDERDFIATWTRCFAERVPFTAEYRLADACGAWCWIHHIGHPFCDGAGTFLGYICTLFDVTERKRDEDSLRVSAAVFDHAGEAIMITDMAGRIEAVNPAFTQITGYTAAEAIGASANLLRSGLHEQSFYSALWQTVMEQGRWQGEIINRRKNGEVFPVWLSITAIRDDDGQIARMLGIFSDIVPASTAHDHLMQLAHHDALTGLPNRLLFDARARHSIERCTREASSLAVVFVDLDGFKPVNDVFGHKTGDRVLREVAAELKCMLRDEDTVARFGGDEFVALVERIDNRAAAESVAEKLMAAFPIQVEVDGKRLSISASLGISLFPRDGRTVEELIEAADQAMYRAKRERREQAARKHLETAVRSRY